MAKFIFVLAILFALVAFSSSKWTMEHKYSAASSAQIAAGIKQRLLNGIATFTDRDFAQKLQADLNNGNDDSRALKDISAVNAFQLFAVLGLDDPKCDKNGDNFINGDEIKCLNYAWKAFVPR